VRACGWTREEGVRGGRDLVKGVEELALRLVVLVWVQQQLAYPLDRERRPAACGAPHRAQLGRKRCTGCVYVTRVRDIGPGVGQELPHEPFYTSSVAIPISARNAWSASPRTAQGATLQNRRFSSPNHPGSTDGGKRHTRRNTAECPTGSQATGPHARGASFGSRAASDSLRLALGGSAAAWAVPLKALQETVEAAAALVIASVLCKSCRYLHRRP
jgi:hypothetical protein